MSSCSSSIPSTSLSHSDYFSDGISVDSWQWTSTLESCYREKNEEDEKSESDSKSLCVIAARKQWMLPIIETSDTQQNKKTIVSFKKIFKKSVAIISSSIGTLKWRRVYEIHQKQSISLLLSPVSLITYQRIEDKINPVDYVLNYLCNSVQDVEELQKNPQQLSHLIQDDVDGVLQDIAFSMGKMERIAKAEERKRNQQQQINGNKKQLHLKYVDAKSYLSVNNSSSMI